METKYCNKKPYKSKKLAKHIAVLRMKSGAEELRVYQCPWCRKYHLTKQEQF